jgi:transposase
MNHWHGLERFLDDGRIELDTNTIERAMRPVKLSAKNSLFAVSVTLGPFFFLLGRCAG